MDINQGRKIITDMQICFQKMDLQITKDTEKLGDSFIVNHLSFRSWYKVERHLAEIVAVVVFEHDIVQLSMNFYSEDIRPKFPSVLQLLNLINQIRAEFYWQLIPDYEKFEFRTAMIITGNLLNTEQFNSVLQRMLKLGPVFYQLIDRYLNSHYKPQKLLKKFKSKNKQLWHNISHL
jgi:hypothetical protein